MPRDVVLVSTADWDHPFWTNKQHVAVHLAKRGFRVLYVESLGLRRPTARGRDVARIARRVRRAWRSPRQVADNLWVASPVAIPWHANRLAAWANDRWLRGWLGRQCRGLGFDRPILWTYNPLAGSLGAPLDASMSVYHCVDDLSAAPHLPSQAIRVAEQHLTQSADVVFATSEALRAQLAAWNPGATHCLPNVADFDHFSRARRRGPVPPEVSAIPRPRVGFVGALSGYKVDFDLIGAVARARPDWHWVLIGQVGEGQWDTRVEGLGLPNVHWLGPRPYQQLPDYLRGMDVATIPCPDNAYTRAMFPMKFFEYLAAGLPVVAARAPALAEFAHVCNLVESEADFGAAIERVLRGERADETECLRVARQFTWQWRTDQMLAILERAWQARTNRPAATSCVDRPAMAG